MDDEVVVNADMVVNNVGFESLDLSNQGITQISPQILRDIEIELENTRADHEVYFALHEIEHLYLDNNRITHIPPKLFEDMPNLRHLHLDNNEITELPPHLLTGLQSLVSLGLNGNPIEVIYESTYYSLKKALDEHALIPPHVLGNINEYLYSVDDGFDLDGLELEDYTVENGRVRPDDQYISPLDQYALDQYALEMEAYNKGMINMGKRKQKQKKKLKKKHKKTQKKSKKTTKKSKRKTKKSIKKPTKKSKRKIKTKKQSKRKQ